MVVTYAALYRLVNSRLGHLCRSMQQNEELASSIGVNIAYIRVVIFAISSFFGGIGGAMFGSIAQSVYPSTFVVADSSQFHAELLSWRPWLCFWSDAWNAGIVLRLGPFV